LYISSLDFISGSHIENAYNATMANVNKGTYFILTDENHRFITKNQSYVINVSSNEKVDLEEDEKIDGKELLRSAVTDYMKLYINPKKYKGGRLHLMNISNELPFLGILFDNEKGKEDIKLKFEMEKSLEELENNFNSLMQRAFNGELFNEKQ